MTIVQLSESTMVPTQDRIFWMPNFETGSESGTGKMNCMTMKFWKHASHLFAERKRLVSSKTLCTLFRVYFYIKLGKNLIVACSCSSWFDRCSKSYDTDSSLRKCPKRPASQEQWPVRSALRLETRIDLTHSIESWVRFKVFFRWNLEYKSKIFLLKMIVIYNNWNMYFIFIWKLFVQNNI